MVDRSDEAMYMYIAMERTQIYLSETQTKELDRRARERGTTRSQLIREAIGKYLAPDWDPEAFKAALDDFAGIWKDRDDIDEIHAELRAADRRKLASLYPDLYGPGTDDRPSDR